MDCAALLGRLLPAPATDLVLLRRAGYRHSEILEFAVRCAATPPRIVVKRTIQFESEEAAERDLRREFEALQAVGDLLGGLTNNTVPRALALSVADKTLVLSHVPGHPLDRQLRRQANCLTGRFRQGALRRSADRAGAWLGQFHARTAAGSEPFRAEPFLARAHERLRRCQAHGFAPHAAGRILARLEKASAQREGIDVCFAARHGDFIPQNILIEGDRAGCVDFENFNMRDAIYEDVAAFVGHLLLLAAPPYAPEALRAVVQSFLDGYGRRLDPVLLNLYVLSACLLTVAEAAPRRISSQFLRPAGLQARVLALSARLFSAPALPVDGAVAPATTPEK